MNTTPQVNVTELYSYRCWTSVFILSNCVTEPFQLYVARTKLPNLQIKSYPYFRYMNFRMMPGACSSDAVLDVHIPLPIFQQFSIPFLYITPGSCPSDAVLGVYFQHNFVRFSNNFEKVQRKETLEIK